MSCGSEEEAVMKKKRVSEGSRPASPNIDEALDRFLAEQRKRLKPATVGKYEDVIDFFKHSMNGYAYGGLDEAESALFDRLYNERGKEHREFCQIFGPEKIPENVDEFLGYFMVRKVMCGKELLKAAGSVMRKLAKWLAAEGYIDADEAEDVRETGSEASRELPAADELADILWRYAEDHAPGKCKDTLDGYFDVKDVEPGKLRLSSITCGVEDIVVPVPEEVTDRCKVGWQISLALGKTARGWRILEVGNVYAM